MSPIGECSRKGGGASKGCDKAVGHMCRYSSQQNRLNVFNLWKDALILHEINSGKF
jgi:hypothetical protein